jgi:hypothetical protein
MKAMKRLLLLLSCSGALLCGADLASVRAVYVMPMSRGLDQHLANRLASNRLFQVVADPKLADAIFTDRIGEAFRNALDEIAPLPKPEAEEGKPKPEAKDGQQDEPSNPMLADVATKMVDPALSSTFGRGKGTLFLVDAKSREVVWSTFEVPRNSNAKELDRTASDIVSRLKRDLKSK